MRAAWLLLECLDVDVVTDRTTLAWDLRPSVWPEDCVDDDEDEEGDEQRRVGGDEG